MTAFFQALVLASIGTLLLRLGGRKSISEMTVIEVTVMITIGAILGSDVGGKGIVHSLIAVATFVAFSVLLQFIQMKWNPAEKIITGQAIPVIENGTIIEKNLKKLRVTVDNVEMRLRVAGVSRLEDVKIATIEPNGMLGYELMPHAKPVTRGEMEQLLQKWLEPPSSKSSIFTEVQSNEHSGSPPAQHLQ